jgi:hypothetical protein
MNVYKICMKLAINVQKCPTLACFLPFLKNLQLFFKNHCFRVYKTLGYLSFWTFINVQISIPFWRFGKIHWFTLPYHKFSKTRLKNKICEHNFFYFFLNLQTFLKMTKKTRPLAATLFATFATKLARHFLEFWLTMYAASCLCRLKNTRA